MLVWIVFGIMASMPLIYLFIIHDIIKVGLKYGFRWPFKSYRGMPIRVEKRSLKTDYKDDIDCMFESMDEFDEYLKKFEECVDYNIDVMKKIMKKTDIAIEDEIKYGVNNEKIAGAVAEKQFMYRKFGNIYIVRINVMSTDRRDFSEQSYASLIMHEMVHHYLDETEGTPWGVGYSIGHSSDPDKNHPIWKKIGV